MKTSIRTETDTYTISTFTCEICNYETEDMADYKIHFGATHAIAEKLLLNETEFFRFNDEHDFNAYIESTQANRVGDLENGGWTGPGWYTIKCEETIGNCRCGRCHDIANYMQSVDKLHQQVINNINTIEGVHYSKIEKLKKFADDLNSAFDLGKARLSD